MEELTANVSWLSVIIGAIASFLVGWLWYSSKMFGTKWAEGVGVDLGNAQDMPMSAMAWQFVGLLLMSWFVAVTAASNLLLTVILGTVAFTALSMSAGVFAGKSAYARYTEAGFWIVALIIMIIVQGIF